METAAKQTPYTRLNTICIDPDEKPPSNASPSDRLVDSTNPDAVVNEADFSRLLQRVEGADEAAWNELIGLVYADLKRIAHGQMSRIAPGQTLSTTVLVHETFEKLAAQGGLPIEDRSAFYALCACAMRQIIIDHYRKRTAAKRLLDPVTAADHETRRVSPGMENALVDLGRSLDLLARRDERLLHAFEMRYFGGLSDDEIGERMGLSQRSVQRLVGRARSWVAAALAETD
jgi:RNA polymerase sigma factor (TIGR02999 family)